ncbi:hypothetical protein HDV00_004745 [Rhizophlyctis rosea]|nr:hypothetical protein HDV00_004745 [Rhizophlyctis rosea]
MPNTTVKLTAGDGQEFVVSKEVATQFHVIKDMREDLNEEDDDKPAPLANVSGPILAKVLDFAEHHKDDRDLPGGNDRPSHQSLDSIDAWDQAFMEVDQGTIFEIILAANYLDFKSLLDLGCKTAANMIREKTVEEIRRTFNIVNDFSPEEEEQIRKENEWCEDH